eukprot:m.129261 g.129261  ORF g.129261 m.129261 type:complete len:355 (+) comp37975_c0_seq5:46-1110(+)
MGTGLPITWLDTILLVVGSLSLLGAFTIVMTYVLFRDLRGTARLLLVFLSLTDIMTTAANVAGIAMRPNETTTGCQVQAGFAVYGTISSYLWTMFIAIYLYINVTYEKLKLNRRLIYFVFHPLAWGVPLVVVAVAGGLDVFGLDLDRRANVTNSNETGYRPPTVTAGWCFIRTTHAYAVHANHSSLPPKWFNGYWQDFWILMAGGAWELLSYFVCPVAYVLTIRRISKESHESETGSFSKDVMTEEEVRSINRKLTFIPLVYFLLHAWSTVRIILYFAKDYKRLSNEGLLLLEGIGDCGQGLLNCILFCIFTKSVRQQIFSSCKRGQYRSVTLQDGSGEESRQLLQGQNRNKRS